VRIWKQLVDRALDVLAPPLCAACDAAVEGDATFCHACRRPPRPATRRLCDVPLVVAGSYAAPLSTAIARFKYSGRGELSGPLSRLLLPALRALELPRDVVFAPVPLHGKRLAERGYNQAALLARDLARGLGRKCSPRLLARTRDTEHQVGKSRLERLTNAQDAFVLREPATSEVVLIDDVVTTGATVRACAQALARGGVRLVAIGALAEADGADGNEPAARAAS
jgi:ComF family protein